MDARHFPEGSLLFVALDVSLYTVDPFLHFTYLLELPWSCSGIKLKSRLGAAFDNQGLLSFFFWLIVLFLEGSHCFFDCSWPFFDFLCRLLLCRLRRAISWSWFLMFGCWLSLLCCSVGVCFLGGSSTLSRVDVRLLLLSVFDSCQQLASSLGGKCSIKWEMLSIPPWGLFQGSITRCRLVFP